MVNISKFWRPKIIVAMFLSAILVIAIILQVRSARAAYNVSWANFWVGRVTPGTGHIGVDIWWPGGPTEYNPCHHSNDIYYGACVLSNNAQTSYYKVMSYTPSGTNFPYGIFLDNENENNCWWAQWCPSPWVNSFKHGWARLISDGSLEIYPHASNGQYNPSANTVGGVRIQASFFTFANGGRYSPDIGNVALPEVGQQNVGRLNGFATYNGSPVANNRLLLEVFQESATRVTSTGFPMTGFTVARNNGDSYYNLGAVPSGLYKVYATDTATGRKIILNGVHIFSSHERIDFRLEQRCFGLSGSACTDPA